MPANTCVPCKVREHLSDPVADGGVVVRHHRGHREEVRSEHNKDLVSVGDAEAAVKYVHVEVVLQAQLQFVLPRAEHVGVDVCKGSRVRVDVLIHRLRGGSSKSQAVFVSTRDSPVLIQTKLAS
jgi:hypothetical protein